MAKWRDYAELMRFHKPIGTFLLLWPTLWALWLAAKGIPDLGLLLVFVAGVIIMRAAGCVINDIADRKLDKHVSRTQQRPLATGKVTLKEALCLFAFLCFLASLLLFFLKVTTIILACIALIGASIYPFTKRYIYFPQLILGMSWYMAIPMVFSEYHRLGSPTCWLLYTAAVIWTVVFDTEYALCDREEDIKMGMKSTAILFGEKDKLYIGLLQLMSLSLFIIVGITTQLTWVYFLSLGLATLLGCYQQWLIQDREPQACLKAFLNNHWVGCVIFLGLFLGLPR